MNDENWKEEFKLWNPSLKPYQIKLLEEGASSQNQACILNDMWCEWKDIAVKRKIKDIARKASFIEDPWEEKKLDSNMDS